MSAEKMTPAESEAARRAVGSKRFRWMPGMFWAVPPSGAPDDDGDFGRVSYSVRSVPAAAIPDLADPATRGCLLELVREAWRDPDAYVLPDEDHWVVMLSAVEAPLFEGGTEAAALALALEAAP